MKIRLLALCLLAAVTGPVLAHVPHIERADYTQAAPFTVTDPALSIAVYGWLQNRTDVDWFRLEATNGMRLYFDLLVPVLPAYAKAYPTYALIGPGLPAPTQALPFALPPGYGAVVAKYDPATKRPVEYEPFGGKAYFTGPASDDNATTNGTWWIAVWEPAGKPCDYVLAIGYEERFEGPDLVRALVNTKIIRADGELHAPRLIRKEKK